MLSGGLKSIRKDELQENAFNPTKSVDCIVVPGELGWNGHLPRSGAGGEDILTSCSRSFPCGDSILGIINRDGRQITYPVLEPLRI